MPLVTYSLLRLGLLVVALVGLALAGMGGWLLVVVATVVAFVLSYVLLPRQRDAAARWLAERGTRRGGARDDGGASRRGRFARGVEDDAEAEDAAVDACTAERDEPDAGPQTASPSPSSTP